MAHPFQSVQAPINAMAVGTTSLVAAISGARIRVMALVIVATAASTVQLKGATSALTTGAMSLAANGVLVLPYNDDGWFVTQVGEALNIVVGGTGPVNGSFNYVTL
jgi:hypothetical protein